MIAVRNAVLTARQHSLLWRALY